MCNISEMWTSQLHKWNPELFVFSCHPFNIGTQMAKWCCFRNMSKWGQTLHAYIVASMQSAIPYVSETSLWSPVWAADSCSAVSRQSNGPQPQLLYADLQAWISFWLISKLTCYCIYLHFIGVEAKIWEMDMQMSSLTLKTGQTPLTVNGKKKQNCKICM